VAELTWLPVHCSRSRVWFVSDQVSIEALSQAGVHLLVEKDFQCLHKSDEQDPDAYPNPLANAPECE
jgi:hypothetical protein